MVLFPYWRVFLNCIGYIASNGRIIVNDEMSGMWKEAIVLSLYWATIPEFSWGHWEVRNPDVTLCQAHIFLVPFIYLIKRINFCVIFTSVLLSTHTEHALSNCVIYSHIVSFYTLPLLSWGSSVSIVTRLRTGRPGLVSLQVRRWDFFSSPQRPDRFWAQLTFLSNEWCGLFLRGKVAGAKVKSAWSCTSSPPYTFIAWCLIKGRMHFHGVPLEKLHFYSVITSATEQIFCIRKTLENSGTVHNLFLHFKKPHNSRQLLYNILIEFGISLKRASLSKRNIRGCIQKFPVWVHKEVYAYNNKHSLRSNTKAYGCKTH
jgi:hypothetical protein